MERGEIWTASGGAGYAGKPRPSLIVQDDRFAGSKSVTLCGLTTELTDSSFTRPLIEPAPKNGLREMSQVMVDKITTIPLARLGHRIGRLAEADMARVDRSLLIFLGLSG